ncbi:MAG: pyruvate dehydrogenase complex dihydrolipoamide acetyltransferase [Flavobacteriales bacterium]|nr:pyruvate dehydrogenase complex dihydrolipoamide acetyltransferase [Flavobacteriales bacterium]
MAEIVRMPKLSDTMTEGVVAAWHKKVGDKVKAGDLLAEIETDKATMEFESFQEGVLLYIGVEKGKSAPVNAILAILGKEGEDISALLAAETSTTAAKPVPVEEKKSAEQAVLAAAAPVASVSAETRIKASPLARSLAKEKGIDLRTITGSGDGGRIIKRDIENIQSVSPTLSAAVAGKESYTDIPVSQMRKTIARRLSESKHTAPHFYLTLEIDMEQVLQARKSLNEQLDEKISVNDFVIKAAAMALRKHPAVNSSWLGDVIRYNNHIHVGVAVAIPDGLVVPVVRFADTKSLIQISTEVKQFAQKAKDKKIQPDDMQGNTFSISNLGMYGIDEFTAIINPPDACIMAVGGIKQVPVVKNGQVVPGNVMKVTLSCDHRVVDGATGAEFLRTFKQMLENPVMMLA